MIKKAISHLIPITKKVRSLFSGQLEISWVNGRKVLETKNANYSYGSAQKVLQFSLEQINISGIENILLLGLGGGSVIKILRENFEFQGMLTAVDIDPVIIKVAREEFGITEDNNTKIICADAFEYVQNRNGKYGLVIIDLFIDNKVPEPFLSSEFWINVLSQIRINGYFIFNTISKTIDTIQPVVNVLNQSGIEWKEFKNILGTNYLMIGKKPAK